jgi:cysteinyl-tRNA synthetase
LFALSMLLASCGGGGGAADSGVSASVGASGASAGAASGSNAASGVVVAGSPVGASGSAPGGDGQGAGSSSGSLSGSASTLRFLPPKPVWAVYYGQASKIDLAQAASTFKVFVIDADPGLGPAFSAVQIATLKAGGARVLSYLNLGSCETFRTYWNTVPAGFVSCGANTAAQLGFYSGESDEYWMNPANADYQNLLVNYVAPRLAAAGVDGFMLDNFEIVGHAPSASDGPCNAACSQGGLDLVARLRSNYPNLSIVLNNAPTTAINGTAAGVAFPTLVDGVFAEEVFSSSGSGDSGLVQQLQAWSNLGQNLGHSDFFVGTLDYETNCTDSAAAQTDWTKSQQAGFSPSIATKALNQVCWWTFL